jgi:hypothetical protein
MIQLTDLLSRRPRLPLNALRLPQKHLLRELTVSNILVVSKDGSRFPGTLSNMLQIYRRAFGESWISCVCVIIGVDATVISKGKEADAGGKTRLVFLSAVYNALK